MNLDMAGQPFTYLLSPYQGSSAWLKWLMIQVLTTSDCFDTVPHDILCSKLKKLDIAPYAMDY